MMIGTAHDIMSKVTPPRAVFVDHPVGRTFGPPHNRLRNEEVLARALDGGAGGAVTKEFRFHGDRSVIKQRSSQAALDLLRRWILSQGGA